MKIHVHLAALLGLMVFSCNGLSSYEEWEGYLTNYHSSNDGYHQTLRQKVGIQNGGSQALHQKLEDFKTPRMENPFQSHLDFITNGVTSVDGKQNWPSLLGIFGKNIFPIATDENGVVLIAGGLFGKGRVLVSGHEAYHTSGNSDPGLTKLTQNAVQWLAQADSLEGIKLSSMSGSSIGDLPTTTNIPVSDLSSANTQVYYVPMSWVKDEDIEKILSFVEGGGALIVAGSIWGWFYDNGGTSQALKHPGNKLTKKFGAMLGSNVFSAKSLSTNIEMNLFYALDELNNWDINSTEPLPKAVGDSVAKYGNFILTFDASSDPDFADVFEVAMNVFNNVPDEVDKALMNRLVLSLLPLVLSKNPSKIRKATNSGTFPGAISDDTERVTETLTVNGTYAGYPLNFGFANAGSPLYVSTGLYAAAGDVIKIELEPSFYDTLPEKHGFEVQIGIHTDTLYDELSVPRSPEIVTRRGITGVESIAGNPWGGLIYIRVPHGANYTMFKVTIKNAVKAPYFVLGKHSLEEWKSTIRNYPAPFGELESSDHMILSVQSSELRNYEDPEELLKIYTDAIHLYNYLQGFEGDFRFRAERYIVDLDIGGGGWMHSGYPVMGYTTHAKDLLNVQLYKDGLVWGEFHELGHNSQQSGYTTGATTESGCNVYAHYINSQMFPGKYGSWYPQPVMDETIVDWLLNGRDGYTGFLAAGSYVMLMDHYGYEHWRNMNRFYLQNPDQLGWGETYDMFTWVMANVMKMDVCPYFEFFTYKLSQKTLDACKALPPMPDPLVEKYLPVTEGHPTEHDQCPLGWIPFGHSCFFIDDKEQVGWNDAEDKCAAAGESNKVQAHLASCLTQEESFFLSKQMRDLYPKGLFHIGIDENNEENVATYLDGSALPSLLPWKAFSPKQDENRCTIMEGGKLRDVSCSTKGGFICKSGQTACGPKIKCPEGWSRYLDRCYWFFIGGVEFDVAAADCQSKDAQIIEINSKGEAGFFRQLVETAHNSGQYGWKNYWLGMTNVTSGVWTSGEPVTYSEWCEGVDPASKTGAAVALADKYCWKDWKKTGYYEAYICEKSGIAANP